MENIDFEYIEKGEYAPRENYPWVKRENIAIIVQYKDEYLFLAWNEVNYQNSLVTGGIKKKEKKEDAIKRELEEETGYKDIKEIIPIDAINISKFFVEHKKQNREAIYYPYLVILNSKEQQVISKEEKKEHSLIWIEKENLDTANLFDNHRYMLNKALSKQKTLVKN